MKTQWTMMLAATLATGCGSAPSRKDATGAQANATAPATPAGQAPAAGGTAAATGAQGLMLGDSEAAGQTISAQIDTGVAALAEEAEGGSSGGFGLAAAVDRVNDVQRFRACTVQGSDALVDIRRSVTRDYSLDGPRRSVEAKLESYSDRLRTWSSSNGPVACAADGKRAALTVPTMAGVSLDVKLSESRSRDVSVTNKRTGAVVSRSFKASTDGTRHVDWASVTLVGSTYQIQKSATQDVERQLELHLRDGSVKSVASSVKTAAGAPLQILVERNKDSLAIVSRTIQSGTLTALHRDGTRVDTVFKNVSYLAGEGCMPASGEIDGSIFKSGDTQASLTYVVSFSEDEKKIAFSNGKVFVYTPDGCDLDSDLAPAADAAAAAAVTPPAGAAPAASPAPATTATTTPATPATPTPAG